MRLVIVAMIIMRMAVVMCGASFAESTVGASVMVICEVCFLVFKLCLWLGERKTDDGSNVPE